VSFRTPRPGAAHPDRSAPGLGSRLSFATPSVRSSLDYFTIVFVHRLEDRFDRGEKAHELFDGGGRFRRTPFSNTLKA